MMILKNLSIDNTDSLYDISISGTKIDNISESNDTQKGIDFESALAFPGLINMHEHLSFNLFPALKSRTYENYLDWGADIHKNYKLIINEVLNVPVAVRVAYGELKNILCGFTTVCNHENPRYSTNVLDQINNYHYLHSIGNDKYWKKKILLPRTPKLPWMVHLNEGYGDDVQVETHKIQKYNLLNKKIIGIHGVSLDSSQCAKLDALVWCPDSNFFLYEKSIQQELFNAETPILFGTDSTVSSSSNIWDHIRLASEHVKFDQLFKMLTVTPSRVFKDFSNRGQLNKGYNADLVIANSKQSNFQDSFLKINPEEILLVIKDGEIVVMNNALPHDIKKEFLTNKTLIEAYDSSFYIQQSLIKPLLDYKHIKFSFEAQIKINIVET